MPIHKNISVDIKKQQNTNINYSWFARIYDRVMGDAIFPIIRKSFEMAINKYRIPFKSLADIGCGTGTFLQYIQRYFIPIFGVDRSPDMLRIALEKTKRNRVRLLQQDIIKLRLPKPVDLITCNFDTLNYILSFDDIKTSLSKCHSNLTNSGHFIFDMIAGAQKEGMGGTVIQKIRLPEVLSTWVVTWCPKERSSAVIMDFAFKGRDGGFKRAKEIHYQRWYPLSAICQELQYAGFKVRGVHDVETFKPATSDTFWVKYIARKN